MNELEDLLRDYAIHSDPRSNADLRHWLRLYPQFREEIIEFTADWRALSMLDQALGLERKFIRRAQARLINRPRRRGNDWVA
jgi:hypothetical protein